MNDEHVYDELLDHDYDGIREYDNPLPGWWLWLFYLCIAWAFGYLGYYWAGPGLSIHEAYAQEMAAAEAQRPKRKAADVDMVLAQLRDDATLTRGRAIFAKNCVPCHGPDGGGVVGPNLCDDFFLHGPTEADALRTITDGVVEKGMIAWGAVLKPDELVAVTVFVRSLLGTTPATPKAPQGQQR